jgi:hypothetical protein
MASCWVNYAMFLRALLAFLALPGMVAVLIPVLIALEARNDHPGSAAGFGLVGLGLFLLLWCVRDPAGGLRQSRDA